MGQLKSEVLARLNSIVRERKELGGPSQRQLAVLIGCSSAHMTHLLTGRSPLTLDWLDKICAALKIDAARLFDDAGANLRQSAYDVYESPEAAVHERLQGLIERGFISEAAALVDLYEKALDRFGLHLEALVLRLKADAAILWRRIEDEPKVLASTLDPPELQAIKANRGRGWQVSKHGEFALWILSPRVKDARSKSEIFLEVLVESLPGRLLGLSSKLIEF